MNDEKVEKILERISQVDYTAEHGKMKVDYAIAYNEALSWVLDVIFDFQMAGMAKVRGLHRTRINRKELKT